MRTGHGGQLAPRVHLPATTAALLTAALRQLALGQPENSKNGLGCSKTALTTDKDGERPRTPSRMARATLSAQHTYTSSRLSARRTASAQGWRRPRTPSRMAWATRSAHHRSWRRQLRMAHRSAHWRFRQLRMASAHRSWHRRPTRCKCRRHCRAASRQSKPVRGSARSRRPKRIPAKSGKTSDQRLWPLG